MHESIKPLVGIRGAVDRLLRSFEKGKSSIRYTEKESVY